METNSSTMPIPEIRILLDFINDRKPCSLDAIDFRKLSALSQLHGITPLVFSKLKNYNLNIPRDVYLSLKSCYLYNLEKNLKFWHEFLRINALFKESNIAVLPLKGIDILTRFYSTFTLRTMVDIDLLIKEEQFAQAQEVLSNLGYQKKLRGFKEEYWRKSHYQVAFYKNKLVVELHWRMEFKRNNAAILPYLWKRTNEVMIENNKVTILSPEDALFSLALNLRHFGNIYSLRQILDATKIIKASARFDWDYVLKEARQGMVQATLYFILLQLNLFTDIKIPVDIMKKLKVPFWQKALIKKSLLRHTFQIRISVKKSYLGAYFLLYDNIWKTILYLINVPYEQFCQFYNLTPYTRQTNLLYNLRFIYMPISFFLRIT